MLKNKGLMESDRFRLNIFDNSLGKGNASVMDMKKFQGIKFDSNLKHPLDKITKSYYDSGEITKQQYEALL